VSKPDLSIMAAIGVSGIAGATLGLAFPLLALNLDDWGIDPGGIGFFTLSAAVSTLLATPLVPPVLARAPLRLVLIASLAALAVVFIGYHLARDFWAWMGLRTIGGMAFAFLFVGCEAWILERTPPDKRGLIIGIFASVVAGSMAVGGIVIGLLGHTGPAPFFAGAGLALAGMAFALLPGPGLTAPEGAAARPSALLARIAAAPAVMMAPFIMGAVEIAKYNLIPIYARRVGLGDDTAALMVTASGVGVLLLQPLIGLLADRLGVRLTLALCAACGVGLPLALLAVAAAPGPALALTALYSGTVTGLYTVGLIWLAQRFQGGDLAGANAAYALAYGMGQLLGPAVAGPSFAAFGPAGFIGALAGFAALYLAGLAVANHRNTRRA
jgi:predicted MFS family arabinose efflux permease